MSQPIRLDEDIYGVTELRDSLQQVVEKVQQTKRPMIITKRNKPVAAIIDIGELQRLYDEIEELEDLRVLQDFEAAEARGDVKWYSHEETGEFIERLIAEARGD